MARVCCAHKVRVCAFLAFCKGTALFAPGLAGLAHRYVQVVAAIAAEAVVAVLAGPAVASTPLTEPVGGVVAVMAVITEPIGTESVSASSWALLCCH